MQTIQGTLAKKLLAQRAKEEAAPELLTAGAFPARAILLCADVGDGDGDVDAKASCLLLCPNLRNQPARL